MSNRVIISIRGDNPIPRVGEPIKLEGAEVGKITHVNLSKRTVTANGERRRRDICKS